MKTNKLMLAVVAVLAAGASNIAQADSIALAQLDIDHFRWTNKATGAALSNAPNSPIANRVNIVGGNNSGNLSVGLGAASSPGHHDSVPIAVGGQIAPHTQCLGACGSAPTLPPSVTGTFAYASHSLTGAIIDLDTNGASGPEILANASAHATAESSAKSVDGSSLVNNGTADLGTNTRFSFVATANLETLLSLDYIARAMAAVIAPHNGATDTATASIQWNLSLNDNTAPGTNTLFDVTSGAPLGTSWVPSALNHTSIQVGGGTDFYNVSFGSLAIQANLLAGHEYTIGIGHSVQSNVTNVPEPAIPALIGAGLLAFGLKRKRNASDVCDMSLLA